MGYLEGIFVEKEFRRRGYASALLKACEAWAASGGCTEFAADCGLENEPSRNFHLNTGFAEANRIICFVKKLSSRQMKESGNKSEESCLLPCMRPV